MKSRSFQLASAFLLLILLSSPPASSASDQWFLNCREFLNCMTISTMKFPLWRSVGTESCGHPETIEVVNCGGSSATVEILGAEYELVGFSTNDQILLVAQTPDYFSYNFCSQNISSFIYGIINLSNHFGSGLSYLRLENKTADTEPYCKVSTVVSISPMLLQQLGDMQNVEQRIRAKFESRAKVDAQECERCSRLIAGVCSYNLHLDRTSCYCKSSFDGYLADCSSASDTTEERHPSGMYSNFHLFLFSLQHFPFNLLSIFLRTKSRLLNMGSTSTFFSNLLEQWR